MSLLLAFSLLTSFRTEKLPKLKEENSTQNTFTLSGMAWVYSGRCRPDSHESLKLLDETLNLI
jgi:hypothetical protein